MLLYSICPLSNTIFYISIYHDGTLKVNECTSFNDSLNIFVLDILPLLMAIIMQNIY